MKIDRSLRASASERLLQELQADHGSAPEALVERVAAFRSVCQKQAKTVYACFATQVIAKFCFPEIDIRQLQEAGLDGAVSLRTVAEKIAVPFTRKHSLDMGVSSPQPFNNSPLSGRVRIDSELFPEACLNKQAGRMLCEFLDELAELEDESAVRPWLHAFFRVARSDEKDTTFLVPVAARLECLLAGLDLLLREHSEGGKRAQALVAGVADAFWGAPRVRMGRINDPSVRYLGDVVLFRDSKQRQVARSFEVRDKPVSGSDLRRFARALSERGYLRGALVGLRGVPGWEEVEEVVREAERAGVSLRVYSSWSDFIREALQWVEQTPARFVDEAWRSCAARLGEIEVEQETLDRWQALADGASAQLALGL